MSILVRTQQFYVLLAIFNVQLTSSIIKFIGAMIPVALWDLLDGFDEDFVLA